VQKILLIVGIPLLAVAGIVAYETGNILWFGLGLPLMALRYYQRRILRPQASQRTVTLQCVTRSSDCAQSVLGLQI